MPDMSLRTGIVLSLTVVLTLGTPLGLAPTPTSSSAAADRPAAAPARAADLVVRTPGARAVIERHPFRLRVEDGAGRTVLQQVAPPDLAVQVEPPTVDPVPPGVDNQATTTLYAPFSFLVGTERLVQQPAEEWIANLLTGTRSGVQYAARDVLSARRDGAALRLVLSTSDPSGRRLVVRVAPQGDGAIRVTARPDPAAGVAMLGDSFVTRPGEPFHGFGGRHDRLDQRGRALSSFVNQENLAAHVGEDGTIGLPGEIALFPNGPAAAYYPQPLTYTRRYGFLLAQPELARFKLAVDRDDAWNVTASAPRLDYVVAPGGPRRATRTLTALTGRQRVAPDWALGTMLDRLVRNQDETVAHYEAMLRADLRNIDRHHLPLTGYRIEGSGFPDGDHGLALHTWVRPHVQAWMIRQLRRRGIHALSYLRPWLEPGSAPVRAGYAVRDADGDPSYVVGSGERRFALVDFTRPAAVRWWGRQVAATLDMEFDGFMQDYGEQVLLDMRFADGSTGVTRHNSYLTLYAKATREALDRYGRRHPRREPWFFTRAGYTGLPGNAAYEGGTFPGDETTDWGPESGLKSLAPDMLNRAVGGAYGFTTDIGGYLDYTTPPTSKALFLRWAEWAALSPIFRLHGTGLTGTHTPWSYDAQTVRIYNRLSRLHLRARPLIRRLWQRAHRTGAPVTRPLWWQYPDDPRAARQSQEWLLGPDVLVAPVVDRGARSRAVYLPAGCWVGRGAASGRRYDGRRSVTVTAGLGELPWFTRCGTDPL